MAKFLFGQVDGYKNVLVLLASFAGFRQGFPLLVVQILKHSMLSRVTYNQEKYAVTIG